MEMKAHPMTGRRVGRIHLTDLLPMVSTPISRMSQTEKMQGKPQKTPQIAADISTSTVGESVCSPNGHTQLASHLTKITNQLGMVAGACSTEAIAKKAMHNLLANCSTSKSDGMSVKGAYLAH